tara:strand:+ start:1197 stop:1967 length:771 start_codon:yes stop_codon:yes gene_type:complete
METNYIKCKGCNCRRTLDEYEIYKEIRRKTCNLCKEKRDKYKEKAKEYRDKNKEYHKEYREKNKDTIKEQAKEYRENNKDNIKEYRENNKDTIKEYQYEYHVKNKDIIAIKKKEYREKTKCDHNKRRGCCSICYPQHYLVIIQRASIKRILKNSSIVKNKSSISYLGCDIEYFKEYITKKMTDGMTFQNIHIDHIKPISSFNLSEPEQFLDCCNYTNLQPLFIKDNLEKSNKWTYSNDLFWRENIINKEYMLLYPF